jgi:putative serine protease PepD
MNEITTPSTDPVEPETTSVQETTSVDAGMPSQTIPTATTPTKKPGPRYWRWYLAAFVLGAAVVAGAIAATGNGNSTQAANNAGSLNATTRPTAATTAYSNDDGSAVGTNIAPALRLDARAVGEKTIPSVVTVKIRGAAYKGQETQLLGSGSGIVYDTQGHIITNNHVAEAGSSYEVVFPDGRVYPAEVVGTDPTTDLAVLKVTARDLHPIAIGSTDGLTVGDPAVAVGNPLGLEGGPSLTVGVLSAFNREVQTDSSTILSGMLQTDAPITQGSSGGALVDSDGGLIGITTAVGVSSVGVEGIGFATPVEIVTRVADEIIATGRATSPYLGVEISPAMEDTTDGGSAAIGMSVDNVVAGTAADQAGLQAGDVVTAINGIPVTTYSDLVGQLRRYPADAVIKISLSDGRTLEVTLGQRPANL